MPLKLTGLTVDNYKRITLAQIEFDPETGGVVALMGENEAGKSSALDAFEALIAGRAAPTQAMPIHAGAKSARIIGTFREDDGGELVVTRDYTATGTNIKVATDGLTVKKPGEILSRLYSHVALDPLAFANLESKKQTETLLALIGFDPTALDVESANTYATRTEVGQEVKRLKGQLSGFREVDETLAAADLVDVGAVQSVLEDAREHNATRAALFAELRNLHGLTLSLEESISAEEERLAAMRAQLEDRKAKAAALKVEAEGTAELPITPYLDEINSADQTNESIREQRRRAVVAAELGSAEKRFAEYTARIEEIAREKAKGFAEADMPIPGLTVEDGIVTLDGTPFSQASAGAKLRTSTAIAMALNPDLRAIVIRDGSLLDAKNRAIIDDLAKANDFTVLMEIVDESAPAGVIFEGGKIREVRK